MILTIIMCFLYCLSSLQPFTRWILSDRRNHFQIVIRAFFTSRLDHCNTFQSVSPILASLHWLSDHFRVHFKIILFSLPRWTSLPLCSCSDQQISSSWWNRGQTLSSFAVTAVKLWNALSQHGLRLHSLAFDPVCCVLFVLFYCFHHIFTMVLFYWF